MPNEAHFHRLERLYYSAPINKDFFQGSKIEVTENSAKIELEVSEKHHHAAHAMHGATYFKLMDDAAYFASASVEEEFFILTKSYQIELLRPVVSGTVKALGSVVDHSDEETVAIAELYNDQKQIGRPRKGGYL